MECYLLFHKDYFKKLADCVKDLEDARDGINNSIQEARRDDNKILPQVVTRLERVDEVIKEVNKLQNDPRRANAVGCSGSSSLCPNFILRHKLSRKASKIAIDVNQLLEKADFDQVGYEIAPDEIAFSSSSNTRLAGEILETRESFKEDILKALKDPNASYVGVYGLGGVGKSTLVGEVAQIAKHDKLFHTVVKAHVSEAPNIENIQQEIAEQLGLNFKVVTVANRADYLRHRIKGEINILVILDDIWTILDLYKVGIPSGDQHNGCKLFTTSRRQDVLLQMGVRKNFTFRLDVLSDTEAWSLFKSMVGDVVNDISLQSIAIKVAKKCGGLPLGIAALASTLRDKDIYVWEDALRQLDMFDHTEHDDKIYSMLEFSYNYLNSPDMKAFFLLFAIIRENLEYYFIVGMGLGLFRDLHTLRVARIRLRTIIASLKASCLLLEDNSSTEIKMHDRVREVAISIASKNRCVLMVNQEKLPSYDSLRNCHQIILYSSNINVLPERLDCPHIKLFIFDNKNPLKISDTFFEGMRSLEVLDLTSFNFSALPMSFHSLTSLKTLCLDHCTLENMDAIGSLVSLEIFRSWNSSMNKLPSEIGKLIQLRILDLRKSTIGVIPLSIISSLSKLEELKMGHTSIKWEYDRLSNQNEKASLVELQQLSNLTTLELHVQEALILPRELQLIFDKLTSYKIAIGDIWKWSEIENLPLKTLMLKLKGTKIHLEFGIKALIEKAENLYLDEVDDIINVLYQLSSNGFQLLKCLNIQNNAKVKHLVDSMEGEKGQVYFPNLESLVFQNLKNLEQICKGELIVNSFGKLIDIKVVNCVQLKHLFSFSMVKGLSLLSTIQVCQCNNLKKIVHETNDSSVDDRANEKVEFVSLHSLTLEYLETLENFFSYELATPIIEGMDHMIENSASAPLFSVQVVFPNLHTLKLSKLYVNKIWDANQHSLDNLTNLTVDNCGGLKYLFSSTIINSFKSLKRLEISNCHLMEEIIATDEINISTTAMEEVPFCKLETIILEDMKNLKTIWHHQFEKVKSLRVKNCEKIVVVFPSSMQRLYNNLEALEVTNCASLEEIFKLTSNDQSVVEDKTYMKEITLQGLPNLKKIWSQDPQRTLGFGNLEKVYLDFCGSLEYLFPFSIANCCSHLMVLLISRCENMKEIIAKKEEPMGTAPLFDFNHLKILRLYDLVKLQSFYAGNHTLECESLREIQVNKCKRVVLYQTLSPSSPEKLSNGRLLIKQAFFNPEQVIQNLERLSVDYWNVDMILQDKNVGVLFPKLTYFCLSNYENEEATFLYWFLHNVPTLKDLSVEMSSCTKIFPDERPKSEEVHARLRSLSLQELPKLQHICEEGSRIDPVLEVLENWNVCACDGLTSLLPSSVTFSHLTNLSIQSCNGLINLITSSTAQSMVMLRTMTVSYCDSIGEIIVAEQNVDIAFVNLEKLYFGYLPKLNKFCSSKCFLNFPKLTEVVVEKCPHMKIFCEGKTCTPKLQKVKSAEWDKGMFLKENLNDTVKYMFENKKQEDSDSNSDSE